MVAGQFNDLDVANLYFTKKKPLKQLQGILGIYAYIFQFLY